MAEKIYQTTNYDLFDLHEVNREVKTSRVGFAKLLQSMKTHGFLSAYPLHCVKTPAGRLQIKGGHHRLEAAKMLRIAVKYIISDDHASIISLEKAGAGRWGMNDYFTSFCKQGIPAYLEMREYMERTGISLGDTASMFFGQSAGSGNFAKDDEGQFATGKFTIKNRVHPAQVAEICLHLKKCGGEWASRRSSVNAISKLLKVPGFDTERFCHKATTFPFLLTRQRNVQNYLDMFEEIYNYKTMPGGRSNIAFIAQELATKRQVNFGT